ncbi:MAG: beta-galactosidase [Prevotella sp.]|nr:beta-galactosidase [Prevotella sp.]
MKKLLLSVALLTFFPFSSLHSWAQQPAVSWDSRSLLMDGRRVVPVMGEIHYSRIPADEWPAEVRKMKEGGVTMIATYVFWNHVEEIEGQFDWSGQRNLRRFLEVCKAEQLPVVLRLGPFCHGEVRNGGVPDWAVDLSRRKDDGTAPMKMRSTDAHWLDLCAKLYRQIFTQVQGLQWKDGGPVVAAQFDNEYRGAGDYLMALKRIALGVGFDLPFYTRTGWPELSKPVPFGEMIPLYGDYADGFWERSIKPAAGNYWKAFFFKPNRDNKSIGTDIINYSADAPNSATHNPTSPQSHQPTTYPFFTCELGGGMATAYHRRPYMYADDALAMAVVKLGSGSNLLGYYMYHGGTNPEGKVTTLNENQRTPATNHNDLPVKTYDFQAPLGEFGQRHEVYYRLRPLHLMMHDFGEMLAPMDAHYPDAYRGGAEGGAPLRQGDDLGLRWSYRSAGNGAADAGFIFFNNYERLQSLSAKRDVAFTTGGVTLPPMTIPAGAIGVLPVNVEGMQYATAQLVARRDGKVYLMQIDGIPVNIRLQNGKTLRRVKPRGTDRAVYRNLYLLTRQQAEHLFLPVENEAEAQSIAFTKVKEAGALRTIGMGAQKVAESPTDDDFREAAVYKIQVDTLRKALLDIDYQGDCARLYANGRLVDDNFYDGHHFMYGLWRLPQEVTELELRILPMQKDAPIYFPREADTTPGERVVSVKVVPKPSDGGDMR